MKRRLTLIAVLVVSTTMLAQRTPLKPGGINVYSPADDVKLGQQVAQQAEKELTLVANREITAYVAALGQRLVAKAPNENKFPFTFKLVDDRSINAFALPGGPIYVHRGAIEAADNEAQIAGVIGHEIGHVILRHGTNQATKAQVGQVGLSVLGGLLGNSSTAKIASAIGGFTANSVLLKYSRDAETQSDLMGTQILFDTGYAPVAMAQFFEKLAKEHKGSKTEQFFSNHPIPENRVKKVNDEIKKIGAVPTNPRTDSPDFQSVKRTLLAMPEPPKPPAKPAAAAGGDKPAASGAPPLPSARLTDFQITGIQLRHPDNWKPSVHGTNITLAPDGGASAKGDLAYGMIVDVFKPPTAGNLDQATQQFLQDLQKGNPAMKLVRSRIQSRVDGQPAQLTEVTNESPAGGQETDIIITVLRPKDRKSVV